MINNYPDLIYQEWFFLFFSTFMFTHLVWTIQKRLEREPKKTADELMVEQYEKVLPEVWDNKIPDGQNVFRKPKGLVVYKFLSQ
tara:strand:- start:81 stop:332 length:252 start_codon:yes stop_codon:yes gene_type:complete